MKQLRVWLSALVLMGFVGLAWGASVATPVDINTANAATLAKCMKGVGKAKSEAIVKYRTEHGNFASIDDLTKVTGGGGISKKIIEDNRATATAGKAAPAKATTMTPATPAAAPKPATTMTPAAPAAAPKPATTMTPAAPAAAPKPATTMPK